MNKRNLITRVSDLPDWFTLAKYEKASTFLDQFYWYIELQDRRALKKSWSSHGTLETGRYPTRLPDQWKLIQKQGLVTLPEEDEEFFDWETDEELHAKFHKDQCYLKSIHTLTKLDGYGFFWFASDQKKFIEKVSIYFSREQEREIDDKAFEKVAKWLRSRCTHSRKEGAFINVDLKASDEQIKKDFAAWLSYERAYEAREVPKKNFTAADFLSWCQGGILPYLDLTLWAQMSGCKISDRVMQKAIFIDENDCAVDPVSRLKTTKKKANYLLSDEVLGVLLLSREES